MTPTMKPSDLQAWRKRLDLTQPAAGALLGVSKNTIAQWESGRRRISAMAAKFMVTLEFNHQHRHVFMTDLTRERAIFMLGLIIPLAKSWAAHKQDIPSLWENCRVAEEFLYGLNGNQEDLTRIT